MRHGDSADVATSSLTPDVDPGAGRARCAAAPGARRGLVRQLRIQHVGCSSGGLPRRWHSSGRQQGEPRCPRRHPAETKRPGRPARDALLRGRVAAVGRGVAFYDHDAQEPDRAHRPRPGPTSSPRGSSRTSRPRRCTASRWRVTLSKRWCSAASTVVCTMPVPGATRPLIEVGRLEDAPMLLFTAPHGIDHVEHTQPSASYLGMLAAGLRESRNWDDDDDLGVLRAGRRAAPDRLIGWARPRRGASLDPWTSPDESVPATARWITSSCREPPCRPL